MDPTDSDLIQVLISYAGGSKYLRLKVKSSDRVESLKRRIQLLIGIPPQLMLLRSSLNPNLHLSGNCSLAHYGISDGSFLYLEIKLMQIEEEADNFMQLDQVEEDIPEEPSILMANETVHKYRISVLLASGVTISLDVQSCNTVGDLKSMVQNISGIPQHRQKLIFNQKQLIDCFSLDEYHILEQSTLHLELRSTNSMFIFVKTVKEGITTCLEVESSHTISYVKALVDDRLGIPMHQQKLFFAGKQLADNLTLGECHVNNGFSLDLMIAPYSGPMNIFVKTVDGRSITLCVSDSLTIGELKCKIEEEFAGVRPYQMKLFYHGQHLDNNGHTLGDCNVHKDSTLSLFVIQRGIFNISVKAFSGKTIIRSTVKSSETVSYLKSMIEAKEGIPADQQLLLFDGKQLHDNHVMANCYIQDGSTIYLLPLSRGRVQILMRMPQKSALIEVQSSDSIGKLKAKIRAMESISSTKQLKLMFQGKELNSCSKVADYNISWNSILHLIIVPGSRGLMSIAIKSEIGRTTINVRAEKSHTVGQVKERIWEVEGFSLDGRSLFFNGNVLHDAGTLEDYNIEANSIIHIGRLPLSA